MRHRSLWGCVTLGWFKIACVQDRFELILSEYEQEQVGDYATPMEVLPYMIPATTEARMHRNYVDLHLWSGNEVIKKQAVA